MTLTQGKWVKLDIGFLINYIFRQRWQKKRRYHLLDSDHSRRKQRATERIEWPISASWKLRHVRCNIRPRFIFVSLISRRLQPNKNWLLTQLANGLISWVTICPNSYILSHKSFTGRSNLVFDWAATLHLYQIIIYFMFYWYKINTSWNLKLHLLVNVYISLSCSFCPFINTV